MSTCPASTSALFPNTTSSDTERYIVSSPLRSSISTFAVRTGSTLSVNGSPFRAVGGNVYWLGIDENDPPGSITWPSRERVNDAFATLALMGATAVRSTTLGVSVGCGRCLMPSLGTWNANEQAWETFDYALFAARRYGIRLIVPLTDHWDYYHGGIKTFLRWRQLDENNYDPFYQVGSQVNQDWRDYVQGVIGHVSTITGRRAGDEEAVLAWELGNELGGWNGHDYPPPKEWTQSTAQFIRNLTANQFIMSGSYGIRDYELDIPELDFVTNHFYPPYSSNMRNDASKAAAAGKVYIVGEYNWTGGYWQKWLWFATAIPALLALLFLLLPNRWFPLYLRLPFIKRQSPTGATKISSTTTRRDETKGSEEDPFASAADLTPLPTDDKSSYPPPTPSAPMQQVEPLLPTQAKKRGIGIKKWHISLGFFLIATPIAAGVVYTFQPTSLGHFLDDMRHESDKGRLGGSFYWSFFGRNTECCNFVEHNDGYTLHYPGTSKDMRHRVLSIVRNAYVMNGPPTVVPDWLPEPMLEEFDGDAITEDNLPGAACPQTNLTLPTNQTSTSTRLALRKRDDSRRWKFF
ncbi:glycoside hydrolase family 5 protein [Atractiella rhizophila]|nr:glycoside hydrolase family 5 protein [Atractiella rhizophila]